MQTFTTHVGIWRRVHRWHYILPSSRWLGTTCAFLSMMWVIFPVLYLQHQLLMLDSHTAASFQYGRGKRESGIHWHWRNIVSLPMMNFLTREYNSSCTTNSLCLSWCHLTLHYNVTNTILSLSRRLNCRRVEIIVRSKVTLTHSKCTSYIFFRLLNGDNSAHRVASTCNLLSLYYAAASIKLSIACRLTMVGF